MALVSGFQVNIIRDPDATFRQDLANADIVAGQYDDVLQPFGLVSLRRRVFRDPTDGSILCVVWTLRDATKQLLLADAITIRNTLPGGISGTP